MDIQKISLMEAYIIETLRNNGVTNDEMLRMDETSIASWSNTHESFDFTLLKSLAEDPSMFMSILDKGYQIKFLTFNGLVNLIRLKFGKEVNRDFKKEEQGIINLHVDETQRATIQQMLSSNWIIVSEEQGTIAIQQATSV